MTSTTLARHLQSHKQQGAIKHHLTNNHIITQLQSIIENSSEIIATMADRRRLAIAEAIFIHQQNPALNNQRIGFKLKPIPWLLIAGFC